jgi:fluoride exporter
MAKLSMKSMVPFALVFLGGGLGSIARYGIVLGLQAWQLRFPWATLAANALACFVLGFLLGLQTAGSLSGENRLLLATGFCGGFSTFSTFTAESWQLWQNGQQVMVFLNISLNLVLCFVFLLLGLKTP